MASNPYVNVSISGYNSDAPTDDGAQTANNRITWAKQKTKLADPLKVAIEAMDAANDDAFNTIANILVDFTGDFGSGGITGLVPAPGAGDAANNRFLRADGTWTTPAGAGSVTSVATGSGLTGGPITGSGTISLASIANNTVMGNLTGVTAAPSAILLPALLNALDVFQGDLGSGGVKGLVPAPAAGEDGRFLRGDGTWAAPVDNYSGTVTSVATGTGLTGGTITTSGTISLAAISDQTLLVNLSGGSAAPSEHNISELTPYFNAFGGDFGSGGAKGLVPAPLAGDAAAGKVLYADGTWAVPPGASAGEANTASNLGSGTGLYASKSGVDLRFKSLVAGTGISLSNDGTTVTITGSASQSTFIGDAGSGGVSGLVPAPAANDDSKVLRGDGTWSQFPMRSAEGRLTLQSGVAISVSDQTAKTTVYYTPYNGNQISLHDGSKWSTYTFAELSASLSGLTASRPYDVFVYDSGGGTLALDLTAWSGATARATALVLQDGVYVKSSAMTRRYVGTICMTSSTGQCEDSKTKRLVWNNDNRVPRPMYVHDGTDSWNYSAAAWQQARATVTNQFDIVRGLDEDSVVVFVASSALNSTTTARLCLAGVGVDSTSALSSDALTVRSVCTNTVNGTPQCQYTGLPGIGYHYLARLEYGAGADTQTWQGDNGAPGVLQTGMLGTVRA